MLVLLLIHSPLSLSSSLSPPQSSPYSSAEQPAGNPHHQPVTNQSPAQSTPPIYTSPHTAQTRMDSDSGLHSSSAVASELTPLSYGHHTPQFLRQQHQVLEEGESSDSSEYSHSSEHSDTSDHYNRQSSRSRRHHRPRLNPAGGRNRFINSVPPHGTTSYTHSQPHAEVDLNLLKNEKIVWTKTP